MAYVVCSDTYSTDNLKQIKKPSQWEGHTIGSPIGQEISECHLAHFPTKRIPPGRGGRLGDRRACCASLSRLWCSIGHDMRLFYHRRCARPSGKRRSRQYP